MVPVVKGVTKPLTESIVAILTSLLLHVPLAVVSTSVVVDPIHNVFTPMIDVGELFTVIIFVALVPHPVV